MLQRVLVANRGEIALRVSRTLRRMSIDAVCVYTDADSRSRHVLEASEAVRLDSPQGYLDAQRIVDVALERGCDAVHPGYGFLSESASFARTCSANGLTFIGPPADAIALMGDKINAKKAVAAVGVPVVEGLADPAATDDDLIEAAGRIGPPVILKPSGGGGGKGMHVVNELSELPAVIGVARREALASFGDSTLLLERFVHRPRHIEMQVFADTHGNLVALGERECTLQRRHQKVVEEAPSVFLNDAARTRMADCAVEVARACSYVGAGTVEFIVSGDDPEAFFFMEMNTRLQVEHAVTEMVLGVDLVEWQVRVASGEHLVWPTQSAVPVPRGHAIEARVYAEDPGRGFLPSSGTIVGLKEPASSGVVRVDSSLSLGVQIGTAYDPMLAKVVSWGEDRHSAISRLERALRDTDILGVTTNVSFLTALLDDAEVKAGEFDTGLVETKGRLLAASSTASTQLLAAGAVVDAWETHSESNSESNLAPQEAVRLGARSESASSGRDLGAWGAFDGWRVGGPVARRRRWQVGGQETQTEVGDGWVAVGDERFDFRVHRGGGPGELSMEFDGVTRSYLWGRDGEHLWVGAGGRSLRLTPARPVRLHGGPVASRGGQVASPMPGAVAALYVAEGDEVREGERLVSVEAMKMEHVVNAPLDGRVGEVLVHVGDKVTLDQVLIIVEESADAR